MIISFIKNKIDRRNKRIARINRDIARKVESQRTIEANALATRKILHNDTTLLLQLCEPAPLRPRAEVVAGVREARRVG